MLSRAPIAEPARYYDELRTIVMRRGLLLRDERRHLWHELVHADRRDLEGHGSPAVERTVDRAAVRWALPTSTLTWALPQADGWAQLAEIVKLPEDWVRWRVKTALADERARWSAELEAVRA